MPSPPPARRARVMTVVRVVVAAVLLGVLLSRLEPETISRLFERLTAGTLAVLLALAVGMQLVLTERVHTLIRHVIAARGPGRRRLTRLSVLADWQIGAAYSAVLPSSVGGDVARALMISEYLPPPDAKAHGVAVLIVDRLMGLAALCTVPLLFALWWGGEGAAGARLLVACMALFVLGLLWQAPALVGLGTRLVPRRFERVRHFFSSLEQGLRQVPARTRLQVFGWSLVLQVLAGAFFEVAARAWGLSGEVHSAIWVGLPTALVLTVLPVSIGGLGLRESLFAFVFTTAGLPAEAGVALGLLWGVQGLLPALVGAALQAFRGEAKGGGPVAGA